MKAQVVSDLHLEFGGVFKEVDELIPVNAEILILPGDIGILGKDGYLQFFEWASKNFKYVLYVPGNHEFYHHEYFDVIDEMKKQLDVFKNVSVLYRNSIKIEGIRFLGVTLWTKPPNKKRQNKVGYLYNDYRMIRIKENLIETRYLAIEDTVKMHEEDISWLEMEFKKSREEKEVCYLICHHVPLLGLQFIQPSERVNRSRDAWYGEFTDQSDFIIRNSDVLTAVFFGHTHYSSITTFGKSDLHKEKEDVEEEENRVWIISNQVGYGGGDRIKSKYDPNLIFDIPLPKATKQKKEPIEYEGKNMEIWGEVENVDGENSEEKGSGDCEIM